MIMEKISTFWSYYKQIIALKGPGEDVLVLRKPWKTMQALLSLAGLIL